MAFARQTTYGQIAEELRRAILAGEYELTSNQPDRNQLPGAAELGAKYGVSNKTAARAVQQLVSEGLVLARSGMRPLVVPRAQRLDRWPMTGRYARAREAGGLVFGGDMAGRQVVKRITGTRKIPGDEPIVTLLRLNPGDQVWERARETLIDGRTAELSRSYFPPAIAEGTPLTVAADLPSGGVVRVLEGQGQRIMRTYNEARARIASEEELRAFGADRDRSPLASQIVIEVTHATYGLQDEPIEAVISVRPASSNVLVFETYEGDPAADEDDQLASEPLPVQPPAAREPR
jgi:GntR family transcriptional regulator